MRRPLRSPLPDLPLSDAGATGELLVARVRLVLALVLLLIPLHEMVRGDNDPHENAVGTIAILLTNALALLVYALARHGKGTRWLGFVTSVVDVTLVSGALAAFLPLGAPHTAVNSRVVFECYFLAIGGTCLRYDRRICALAGGLAIAEFAAISLYATRHWELNSPAFAPYPYGYFSWTSQLSRMVIMLAATVLSSTIVARAQTLRRLSATDRLTGLWNRSYVEERMDAELSRARRSGATFAVALVDVDFFKAFNDCYGHATGDAALQALAEALRAHVRRSDVVARYGGEEFVLLFPDTAAAAAADRVNGIREEVARVAVATPRHSLPHHLTISAGVAAWPTDGDTVEDLIYRADSRLLAAKRAGRNCTVSAEPEGPRRPSFIGLPAED